MTFHFPSRLFVLLTVLACVWPANAHHSTANFDMKKKVTVQGVVTYFSFTNPHSFIDVDVKNAAGVIEPYKVFATSKVVLLRYGWKPGSIKPGDTITVEGAQDRTNPREIYMLKVVFADQSSWGRDEIAE